MTFFTLHDIPATPWKNGQGTTREIAALRNQEGDILWRISVADIDADGDFSAYPNIDRHLALLTGNGVQLHGTQTQTVLNCQSGFIQFQGEESIVSSLCDGSVRDFNVMTARDQYQAVVTIIQDNTLLPGQYDLLFVAQGSWLINQQICPQHTGLLHCEGTFSLEAQSPDARLFAIQINKV